MPTIITFILIIASFTIASKYELKSIMKKPVKINSSSNQQLEAPKMEHKDDSVQKDHDTDSTSLNNIETHSIFNGTSMKSLPREVSIILMSRLQVSIPLPSGT